MNPFSEDVRLACELFRGRQGDSFKCLLEACGDDLERLIAAHGMVADMAACMCEERDRLGRVITELERRGELRGAGTPGANT